MFLAYLPNVVDYITYKHEQLALSFIHLYLYVYDVNDNMFVKRLLFMKLNYTLLTLFFCMFRDISKSFLNGNLLFFWINNRNNKSITA